jgi:probable rRNA maturation factor
LRYSARILECAARSLRLGDDHEVSLLLCDAPTIRALNRRWRGIDRATNVLSFPAGTPKPEKSPGPGVLGDIALCPSIARREANRASLEFRPYISLLLVHGLLHLMGFDHDDDLDAERMEAEERRILRSISIR